MDEEFKYPGQLIAHLLDERGWTQRVLAIVLGVEETGFNKIVAGKRDLDAPLALALGDVFDVNPERFMELQKRYDLERARIMARDDPGRATRAKLFGDLPVAEMMKRCWIQSADLRDAPKVEAELCRFFGVPAIDQVEFLPHAPKKTDTFGVTTPAQLAWLYRVREIATEMLVPSYAPAALRQAIEEMRPLRIAAEATRKVPQLLHDAGVRFVIVESLASAKIDGVCFWIDTVSPVIAMSLRFDRIDNFWFVLRHECEHVLERHGGGAVMLDADMEGERARSETDIAEEERVANRAAQEFCVPRVSMDKFIARKAPYFPERDMIGFARTVQVHPGIVAGQLQRMTGRYDRFRAHQVKVRSYIAPCAVVDGWGDVAPVGD